VLVLTQMDLLPHTNFDVELLEADVAHRMAR
jgi:hypothetical protein